MKNTCTCNNTKPLLPKPLSSPFCTFCNYGDTNEIMAQNTRVINKQVRMDESLYIMKIATYPIKHNSNLNTTTWNNMSDQFTQSIQIPYHRPSLKPGYLAPGGKGVDVKHGSYQRYINKLKARGCTKKC